FATTAPHRTPGAARHAGNRPRPRPRPPPFDAPPDRPGQRRRVGGRPGPGEPAPVVRGLGRRPPAQGQGARRLRPADGRGPGAAADDRHRVECVAWVGWKSWRRFHMTDALMIDLSRGGARVFVDAPPPTGRAVWVFIETPGLNAIVKARVLEV